MKTENISVEPIKRYVHATFWLAHIGLIGGIGLVPPPGTEGVGAPLVLALMGVGMVSLLGYFVAIGHYASRMGRSAIVWGGLTFITSPVGVWVSYSMALGLTPKVVAEPGTA